MWTVRSRRASDCSGGATHMAGRQGMLQRLHHFLLVGDVPDGAGTTADGASREQISMGGAGRRWASRAADDLVQ
jgi:hypothetical protein